MKKQPDKRMLLKYSYKSPIKFIKSLWNLYKDETKKKDHLVDAGFASVCERLFKGKINPRKNRFCVSIGWSIKSSFQ